MKAALFLTLDVLRRGEGGTYAGGVAGEQVNLQTAYFLSDAFRITEKLFSEMLLIIIHCT